MLKFIKTQLGFDVYASERDFLQYEVWANHPHRRRQDRLHRIDISTDVKRHWQNTLNEKILNNPHKVPDIFRITNPKI